ncbi:MAG: hypothetical protein A2928_04440 [Candidatus Taylorbacteria bacterium RIFCSPLOWO2_01_FULL_45_15b]|uniref:Uncharacterized protein n=1 Tax=Candidatus Taylorbacteria bacterium RIFCSPLOWO2_01_FULL_45_15b TaxID=1802319 RepID=A0A1G2N8N7_9BACT|nr:MAG: hypothetical protein A2928_04440 [Candidatus Taylorbacteria bacterium RIFCSPLOWO2_01_FULL_45_15b]
MEKSKYIFFIGLIIVAITASSVSADKATVSNTISVYANSSTGKAKAGIDVETEVNGQKNTTSLHEESNSSVSIEVKEKLPGEATAVDIEISKTSVVEGEKITGDQSSATGDVENQSNSDADNQNVSEIVASADSLVAVLEDGHKGGTLTVAVIMNGIIFKIKNLLHHVVSFFSFA